MCHIAQWASPNLSIPLAKSLTHMSCGHLGYLDQLNPVTAAEAAAEDAADNYGEGKR